jgi:hypothetical protein
MTTNAKVIAGSATDPKIYAGGMQVWPPPASKTVVRKNWVPNPSFELNTNLWGGPNPRSLSTDWKWVGTQSMKIDVTGGSPDTNLCNTETIAARLVPAGTYTMSAYVYLPVGSPLDGQVVYIRSEHAGEVEVSRPKFTLRAGQVTRVWSSSSCATAAKWVPIIRFDAVVPSGVNGPVYVDSFMMESGSRPRSYFDGVNVAGDAVDGAVAWQVPAEPHFSESTLTLTKERRRCLVPNPLFTVDGAGWKSNNAALTLSHSTSVAGANGGALLVTKSANSSGGNRFPDLGLTVPVSVTVGKQYVWAVRVGKVSGAPVRPFINSWFLNSGGGKVGGATVGPQPTLTKDGEWAVLSAPLVPPSDAASAVFNIYFTDFNNDPGFVAAVDWAMLTEGDAGGLFPFDGASCDGSVPEPVTAWEGAAYASASTVTFRALFPRMIAGKGAALVKAP